MWPLNLVEFRGKWGKWIFKRWFSWKWWKARSFNQWLVQVQLRSHCSCNQRTYTSEKPHTIYWILLKVCQKFHMFLARLPYSTTKVKIHPQIGQRFFIEWIRKVKMNVVIDINEYIVPIVTHIMQSPTYINSFMHVRLSLGYIFPNSLISSDLWKLDNHFKEEQ